MLRFGEDGAEAVVDRIFCATSADARAQYTALLRRLPAARDALNGMLEEDSPAVVERAIALIAQMKFNDAERAIAEELSHAEVRVRRAAAVALGSFAGSAFALDALLRAAQDSSAEVRLPAVVALQARREHRLAGTLVQRLDEEQELDVQLAIITALGKVAAPEGVQKLIALSQGEQRLLRRRDSTTDLRLSAIEAMGEARTPQAMVTLQKLLEDKNAEVRETAARLYTRARRQTSTGSIPAITEP
jgi:HEAT repeat protein